VTESQQADTSGDATRATGASNAQRDAGKRSRGRVGILRILRTAVRTGRLHGGPILLVATVIALAIAVAEVVSDNLIDPRNNALSIGGTVSVEAISLFGTILLAGFLCKLVGRDKDGRPAGAPGERVKVIAVIRSLPWISLVVADILFAVLVAVGLVLLVIPGLILFTLFAVVAPAIEVEHRKPLSGLRRSVHLVRPHFWAAALLVSLPEAALALAESVLPSPHGALHIFEVILIRGIVLAPFEAAFGLVVVALFYRLMVLDAAAADSG